MAAEIPQGEENAHCLGKDGCQGGAGSIHPEPAHQNQVQHHIDNAGNQNEEEGGTGVADSPKDTADAVIGGNKDDACGADSDIPDGFRHGGLRNVEKDRNLGCEAEHKDGEQTGHYREQLDLADYQLPGVPLVPGADGFAQKHRDPHGQAGDKAGEHLHDLAACGYGRGAFGGGELSYHRQVHSAVKGLQKEGEHKGKGEPKKRGKNGAG